MKKIDSSLFLQPVQGEDYTFDFTRDFALATLRNEGLDSGVYVIDVEVLNRYQESIGTCSVSFHLDVPSGDVSEESGASDEEWTVLFEEDTGVGFCLKKKSFFSRRRTIFVDGTRLDDLKLCFSFSGILDDQEIRFAFLDSQDVPLSTFFTIKGRDLDGSLVKNRKSCLVRGLVLKNIFDILNDGSLVCKLRVSLFSSSGEVLGDTFFSLLFDPLIPLETPVPVEETPLREETSREPLRVHIVSPIDTSGFSGDELRKGVLPLTDTKLSVLPADVPLRATVLWFLVRGNKSLSFSQVEKIYKTKRSFANGQDAVWDCNYKKHFRIPGITSFTLVCVILDRKGNLVGWDVVVLQDSDAKLLSSLKVRLLYKRNRNGVVVLPKDYCSPDLSNPLPFFSVSHENNIEYNLYLSEVEGASLFGLKRPDETTLLFTCSRNDSYPLFIDGMASSVLRRLLGLGYTQFVFKLVPIVGGALVSGWRRLKDLRTTPEFFVDFSQIVASEPSQKLSLPKGTSFIFDKERSQRISADNWKHPTTFYVSFDDLSMDVLLGLSLKKIKFDKYRVIAHFPEPSPGWMYLGLPSQDYTRAYLFFGKSVFLKTSTFTQGVSSIDRRFTLALFELNESLPYKTLELRDALFKQEYLLKILPPKSEPSVSESGPTLPQPGSSTLEPEPSLPSTDSSSDEDSDEDPFADANVVDFDEGEDEDDSVDRG